MPLPNIGSMDGNTGRSEDATAEKAVPFPCAVHDPNRSFVELRVGEPRPGARSAGGLLRRFATRRSRRIGLRISGEIEKNAPADANGRPLLQRLSVDVGSSLAR